MDKLCRFFVIFCGAGTDLAPPWLNASPREMCDSIVGRGGRGFWGKRAVISAVLGPSPHSMGGEGGGEGV